MRLAALVAAAAADRRRWPRVRRHRQRDRRRRACRPSSAATQGQTINVLAWPGYVENGSTDPAVDWVTDFQKAVRLHGQAPDLRDVGRGVHPVLDQPEQFDVISASGDASLRLVRGGFVQPVNTGLVQELPGHLRGAQEQAVQHGRRPGLRRAPRPRLEPADVADRPGRRRRPTTWAQMFDPANKYKVSIYDAPIYIADAAVVLMKTKPDLKITNPYALDDTQFAAAVDLLKQQKPAITQRWTDYLKQMDDFRAGNVQRRDDLADHHQPAPGREPAGQGRRHQAARGGHRLVRHLDDQLEDQEPRLRVRVHRLPRLARDQRQDRRMVRRGAGELEVVRADRRTRPTATIFHADDDAFWKDVWYWQTPTADCVDGRTDVKCKGFDDWIKAWTEIKG